MVFVGTNGDYGVNAKIVAFDSKTGKQLWETKLDYSAIAVPVTYMGKNNRQYVAITAANGGAGVTDPDRRGLESLVVYALPIRPLPEVARERTKTSVEMSLDTARTSARATYARCPSAPLPYRP